MTPSAYCSEVQEKKAGQCLRANAEEGMEAAMDSRGYTEAQTKDMEVYSDTCYQTDRNTVDSAAGAQSWDYIPSAACLCRQ